MKYRHYVSVDASNRVVDGFSDAFRRPTESDICITDNGGYQFSLLGEENPFLFEQMGRVPVFKWGGTKVVHRDNAEIQTDIEAARHEEEEEEKRRIENATETILLEMAVDHEYRLSLLELGI